MIAAAVVFWASVALLAYTFAGYPLLAWALAKLRPRPPRKAAIAPDVTVLIVVHNGAAEVRRKVENCLAQEYAGRLSVLVASDGSTDATGEEVESLRESRVKLLAFPRRRGKAACLNDAIRACADEVIVLCDVRQSLAPDAVRHLVENLADPGVGAVSGQLVFRREGMTGFGEGLDAYWRYEKFLRLCEGRVHSSVGVTGAIYALRRECFREIPPQTILDDVLIPMNVVMQGRRVVFEPAALAYDLPSADAGQERTRKIRTLAGNFHLVRSFPALLAPWRNPIALQFISHKVLRLVAPVAMAAALASNLLLALAGGFYAATLSLQLAAYGLAAIGALSPAAARWLPVRVALAFFALNGFVVLGFREFLANPDAHLWARAEGPAEEHRAGRLP